MRTSGRLSPADVAPTPGARLLWNASVCDHMEFGEGLLDPSGGGETDAMRPTFVGEAVATTTATSRADEAAAGGCLRLPGVSATSSRTFVGDDTDAASAASAACAAKDDQESAVEESTSLARLSKSCKSSLSRCHCSRCFAGSLPSESPRIASAATSLLSLSRTFRKKKVASSKKAAAGETSFSIERGCSSTDSQPPAADKRRATACLQSSNTARAALDSSPRARGHAEAAVASSTLAALCSCSKSSSSSSSTTACSCCSRSNGSSISTAARWRSAVAFGKASSMTSKPLCNLAIPCTFCFLFPSKRDHACPFP
mmetsp:Transcript_96811/g.153271  ORF Transcript_96811/g.153271 Transcript_96811/m.153271 type:complete len:314 (+) Transcript_96811:788-1729(+)